MYAMHPAKVLVLKAIPKCHIHCEATTMIICTKRICYVGRVKQASGLAVGVSAVDSVDCPCLWDTCPRVSNNRHYREIKHGLVAHTWRMITKVTAEYSSREIWFWDLSRADLVFPTCNKTSGFLFVRVRRVHSGWFERGTYNELWSVLPSWTVRVWRFHRHWDRWEKNHTFVVLEFGLSVWRRGVFKLFFEWQLLSYCIICKNSFDRFNKWIA